MWSHVYTFASLVQKPGDEKKKMLKFLAKVSANASAIQIRESDDRKTEHFERVKKIRQALGQADKKKSETYSAFPTKLSTIEKNVPQSKLSDFLYASEVKLECKSAILNIIDSIEASSPQVLVESILDDAINTAVQRSNSEKNDQPSSKRARVFDFSKKLLTWMYFVLHEYLGALDFKLAGKAFNVPPTTIGMTKRNIGISLCLF